MISSLLSPPAVKAQASDLESQLKGPIGQPASPSQPAGASKTKDINQDVNSATGGAAFPTIPPLELISPPAVPPTLPPSYFEEGKSDSPLNEDEEKIGGARLQPNEPLKASVIKSGIDASAGALSGRLPSGRKVDVTVVVLSVRNNTPHAIIVDGNAAIITETGAPLPALPKGQVISRTHPSLTGNQKVALVAITALTLGLATVIAGEWMTNQTTPSARFGVYETMRRVEDVRFGTRVVLPGEESRGLLFFDESVKPLGTMSIPVRAYPSNESTGRLSVQITGSATLK